MFVPEEQFDSSSAVCRDRPSKGLIEAWRKEESAVVVGNNNNTNRNSPSSQDQLLPPAVRL